MSSTSSSGVTGVYNKVGQATLPKETSSQNSADGKSFADILLVDPTKKAIEAANTAEVASIQAAAGEIDEQTVAELITEADLALQEFKSIWEKTLQALNELPRVSM